MSPDRLALLKAKAEGLKQAILLDPEHFADEVLALAASYEKLVAAIAKRTGKAPPPAPAAAAAA